MPVYAIAQLTITDRMIYDRYQARFMGVLERYQGRLLAADENPVWWRANGSAIRWCC